ncbi:hypothetical protein DS2_18820 [Catenovulum agarivorans DS-2]|uniref:DUF7939 domain-containing protein n=1 Tax=Catenovulum agarivorans DS-2 TaxID=1328313 RepID=W7Q5W0_9ALTE|nr:BatD family protein [Catenovulum agarivorans]EWH08159.1 hypothetical protein DS2_18820 [Catenovulum agarivorans DS-2]
MVTIKKTCLLISLSLIALAKSYALEVVASVSQNPAVLNESIDLVVTVDDKVDSSIFNFNVLEDNFRVLGTSVSQQTRMVNFDTTRETRFTTRLIPKAQGTFTIPAFSYNGASSTPIKLEVVGRPNQQGQAQNKDIYIEAQLSADSVWLQQQVSYTAKLFIGVNLNSGSLTQPEIPGALVEQQGKDKESETLVNGRRYRVIERTYLITPQRSGEFVIDGPLFQGEVVDGRRSQFFFNQTKTITRTGPSLTLDVKPIPDNYAGHWLPSELVMLNDELSPPQQTYPVGEPITRTITLSALNISAEQLPELQIDYPDSFKVYPDQAQTHTSSRDNQIIAQRIETAAIVPSKAGEFVLPEIQLSWWNTKREKMETATIAEQTIKVVANPSQQVVPPTVNNGTDAIECIDTSDVEMDKATLTENTANNTQPASWSTPIVWALAILTIISWLITLTLLLMKKRDNHKQAAVEKSDTRDEKLAWQQLLKALKSNDTNLIRRHAQTWLNLLLNTHSHQVLAKLIKHVNDPELNQQLAQMEASRYSKTPSSWSSEQLKNALTKLRNQHLVEKKPQLTNLNP